MQTERKIFKNTLLLSAGKGFGDLCSFIFLAYFGRIFGTTYLGKYSFAMALAALLTIGASFGFNTLLVREVSKDEEKSQKFIGNLIIVRGIVAFLIWLLIGLGCYLSNLPSDTKYILVLISGYHIFYRLAGLCFACFKAHDKMHYSAILEFFHKFLILVCGLGCIILFKNPILALGSYPLSIVAVFLIAMVVYWKKFGTPVFSLDFPFIKQSIKTGFPFFFIVIVGQIYDRAGIILLTYMKGESFSGIYSASDRILVTLNAGILIFGGVLFPYMSKLSAKSKKDLLKLTERSIRFIGVVLFALAMLIFILSDEIILLTFGGKFTESIKVLQILVWSLLFMGLNQIISIFLIVKYKEKKLLQIRTVAYLCYCVISIILILKWSFVGLAWAKILVEVALFFITIFYAFDLEKAFKILLQMLRPFASCIICMILYSFIQERSLWFSLPTVLGIYISTLFLFKGIFYHDFMYLKDIVCGPRSEKST